MKVNCALRGHCASRCLPAVAGCTENANRLSQNCESAQVFVIAVSRAITTPMFDDRARVASASTRSESYAKRSRVDTDATRPRRISEHEPNAASARDAQSRRHQALDREFWSLLLWLYWAQKQRCSHQRTPRTQRTGHDVELWGFVAPFESVTAHQFFTWQVGGRGAPDQKRRPRARCACRDGLVAPQDPAISSALRRTPGSPAWSSPGTPHTAETPPPPASTAAPARRRPEPRARAWVARR